jgi:hypothetical protein
MIRSLKLVLEMMPLSNQSDIVYWKIIKNIAVVKAKPALI